jgi:hypothetical protein
MRHDAMDPLDFRHLAAAPAVARGLLLTGR